MPKDNNPNPTTDPTSNTEQHARIHQLRAFANTQLDQYGDDPIYEERRIEAEIESQREHQHGHEHHSETPEQPIFSRTAWKAWTDGWDDMNTPIENNAVPAYA